MSEKEQEVTITEQDIRALTPEHRIMWHRPPGQSVEMGLYVDEDGFLCTDAGHFVRHKDGFTPPDALRYIVRIIPPAFVPRVGLMIGKPGDPSRRLVHTGGDAGDAGYPWLGFAPELDEDAQWFADDEARGLIENHGWEVMGDLAAPGEVTDVEVEAAAMVLAARSGADPDTWSAWKGYALNVLEAAREVRNG